MNNFQISNFREMNGDHGVETRKETKSTKKTGSSPKKIARAKK